MGNSRPWCCCHHRCQEGCGTTCTCAPGSRGWQCDLTKFMFLAWHKCCELFDIELFQTFSPLRWSSPWWTCQHQLWSVQATCLRSCMLLGTCAPTMWKIWLWLSCLSTATPATIFGKRRPQWWNGFLEPKLNVTSSGFSNFWRNALLGKKTWQNAVLVLRCGFQDCRGGVLLCFVASRGQVGSCWISWLWFQFSVGMKQSSEETICFDVSSNG